MKVRFELEAEQEFLSAVAYLRERSVAAADSLQLALLLARQQLVQFPSSGQTIGKSARRLLLRDHPYQLIYRVEGDTIVVYAVAHQSRRPGYWRRRLKG